ncbi:hypothetical protein LSS_13969 [Leptospira santarosai serovar Shermani str. LT 821]|uniref:Uncharacterized protein n=1 Tax=Leptospira santarosai serovar Shermani str. LT 821 TaxID=758847 RepID=K8Y6C4_9LEPT|nr:hypothetical protein LSS_13969 [Leptospira santarosai serovar Shermani str. LT 821]
MSVSADPLENDDRKREEFQKTESIVSKYGFLDRIL